MSVDGNTSRFDFGAQEAQVRCRAQFGGIGGRSDLSAKLFLGWVEWVAGMSFLRSDFIRQSLA